MIKSLAILGSTGSIGCSLLDLIRKDKKNFNIKLLTANRNYKKLINQAQEFKVKNIIVTNKSAYQKLILKKNKNLNIYNNFTCLKKIFKNNKLDITMSSISGIAGLDPSLKIIPMTKRILIANKESIICGWNLIKKLLKKNNTHFIPIDSEHFSIWSLLDQNRQANIEKVFITASGGPFLNLPLNKFSKIKPNIALKHPRWKMGKKISIDSATLMNKVFEVIEAKNIFEIPYKKIKIFIHQESYLHAFIKFNNGLTKLLVHDTDMKIPIFNALYHKTQKKLISKKLDIYKINNFKLLNVDKIKFPSINLLNLMPNKPSLFETIVLTANDELVKLFLEKKISFSDITRILFKIIKMSEFRHYKTIEPKNLKQILELSNKVCLKTRSMCI